MITNKDLDLEALYIKKEDVLVFLKKNVGFLEPYTSEKTGIAVEHITDSKKAAEFHSTSTGYSFYYLSSILDSSKSIDIPKQLRERIKEPLDKHFKQLVEKFLEKHQSSASTDTAPLPNNYNTPLQMAGILAYTKYAGASLSTDQKDYLTGFLINNNDENGGIYIKKIKTNGGFIERIGTEKSPIPSPYHTFWVVESIRLHDENFKGKLLKNVYEDIMSWAVNTLAKSVAFEYSGIPQAFDAIEVSYLLLTILSLLETKVVSKSENIPIYDIRKLIKHSIKIMLSNYFEKGCFTKSLPVFADKKNFSLSCPTVEPIALLLLMHREYFYEYHLSLDATFQWIGNSEFEIKAATWGWRSEWEHSSSNPTSFMTVSVITFLIAFYNFLDQLLSKKAEEILGVLPFNKDPEIEKIKYPGNLGHIVENYFVKPITNGVKELAHYSMILFGPPGTAKTTISKKIAQDLGWPLHVINANSFLKSGMEEIDSEAEKIFRLVFFLNRTVILFDEVEELVLNRDTDEGSVLLTDQKSRLLTTSMLPRINDLRNTARIVFIFATNYLSHIDGAIKRTGRFDCVHCVMPPTPEERKIILNSLLSKYDEEIRNAIEEKLLRSNRQMERFCYADLKDLVKRIIVEIKLKELNFNESSREIDMIIDAEISVGEKSVINKAEYEDFEKAKRNHDRPNPQPKN